MGKRRKKQTGKNKSAAALTPANLQAHGSLNSNMDYGGWSESDDESVVSAASLASLSHQVLSPLDISVHRDGLDSVLPELQERDSESRLHAFKQLNLLLCSQHSEDWIIDNLGLLQTALKSSLRKTSSVPEDCVECATVCRTAALLAVSLNTDDATNLFESIVSVLQTGIQYNTSSMAIKGICEAIACFTIGGCFGNLEAVQEFLETQWRDEDRSLEHRAYILRAWTSGLTSLDPQNFLVDYNHVLYDIFCLLEEENVSLRISAGECLVLFFSCYFNQEEDFDDFDLEEQSDLDSDTLIESFETLSRENNKTALRKHLPKQRKRFRKYLEIVRDREESEIHFKLKKQAISITSWPSILQHDMYKRVLRNGFQNHFMFNELVQERFGYEIELERDHSEISDIEKLSTRYENKMNKKNRERERQKARDRKRFY